jgi:prepilin-type N-terminal cleavage/methylation domain-containing protein
MNEAFEINTQRNAATWSASGQTNRANEAGFSLMEVSVAIVVLAVASVGTLSVTVTTASLDAANRSEAAATAVCRKIMEELCAVPFTEVFARFNLDPLDDPLGVGTAVGSLFSIVPNVVDGLQIKEVDELAIPMDVNISFPVNAAGDLVERNATGAWAGYQLDLNGDGVVTGAKATTYKVLPVMITVSWNGPQGPQTLQVPRVLATKPTARVGNDYLGTLLGGLGL